MEPVSEDVYTALAETFLNLSPLHRIQQLRLRRMVKPDAPALIPTEQASFGRFHWTPDSFCNELSNQLAWYSVLEHVPTSTILGYVGAWFVLDESHVTTLAVHPAFRRFGLGEVLFSHLICKAYEKRMNILTLEVRASNFSAQNLYYSYGMHMVGMRPRYYQDNHEDALLFTSPLLHNETQRQEVASRLAYVYQRHGNLLPQGHTGALNNPSKSDNPSSTVDTEILYHFNQLLMPEPADALPERILAHDESR
jgi:[ribosomal protein S18]-alanine N-acetyltransferase